MSLRIGRAPTLSKSWQVLAHFGGMLNLFMISIVDITHCHIPYINITWAVADICKIYCPSLLRGILCMPNIFHLNRWKLQRRDGVSIRVEMERKAQEEKDDGGMLYVCVHFLCMLARVCRTDQKYLSKQGWTCGEAWNVLLLEWGRLACWLSQLIEYCQQGLETSSYISSQPSVSNWWKFSFLGAGIAHHMPQDILVCHCVPFSLLSVFSPLSYPNKGWVRRCTHLPSEDTSILYVFSPTLYC